MKKLSINQFLTSKVTALDQNQMRHILGGATSWYTVNKCGDITGSGTDTIGADKVTTYSAGGGSPKDDSNLC
ncbi:MAG: hypothetical protein IPO14_08635 [Saprospiraceae bacterium]|nr:hypothetical protein [Saprospiraceae bacterium]